MFVQGKLGTATRQDKHKAIRTDTRCLKTRHRDVRHKVSQDPFVA